MATYIRAHEAEAGDVITSAPLQGRTVTEARTEGAKTTIFTKGSQFTVDATFLLVVTR